MEESQIKQIIEQQPLHGSALLDPRCKILLLVCIGFVSYFLAGEVVSLALMLVYGLFIAVGNGGKVGLEDDCGLHHRRLSQRLTPLCAGAGIERDYERVRCDAFEADPHCDDGPLDFADYLHGRPDGALQRMRLPQAVTIPLVVMFRYIPTLRIEYRQIRSTMDIRGISDTLWKRVSHPLATIEYIFNSPADAVPEGHGRAGGLRHYPGAGAGVQTVRPAPHSFLLAGDPGVPAGHPFHGGAAGPGPDPNRGNHLVEGVT